MTKESLIFLTTIYIGVSLFLELSLSYFLLIYVSVIIIYLLLKQRNRHIGVPAFAATFSVIVILYIFGVIGNCHVCTTEKHGVIFLCNRLIHLAPLNYEKQLQSNICVKELVWVWPKQN